MEFLIALVFILYGLVGLFKVAFNPKAFFILLLVGIFMLSGAFWAVLGLFLT